jgi:hypothetical protein
VAFGSGPPIVFTPWWFNHLEVMWDAPTLRTFFETLAERHTNDVYDRQGRGLSHRQRTDFSLESELRTLAGLVDHPISFPSLFAFALGAPLHADLRRRGRPAGCLAVDATDHRRCWSAAATTPLRRIRRPGAVNGESRRI